MKQRKISSLKSQEDEPVRKCLILSAFSVVNIFFSSLDAKERAPHPRQAETDSLYQSALRADARVSAWTLVRIVE